MSVTYQGEVNLICLVHPQCLHRGCSNRRLLGYVPLSLLRHSTDMNEVVVPVSPRVDPVSPRSNWKGAWQQRVPHAGQSNVVHNASPESIESPVPPHMPANLDQLQSADDGLGEQRSPTSSDISRDRQTRSLSREQSFARVAAENQHAKIELFQAWAVDTGHWGGRELTPEDSDPLKSLP